MIETYTLGGIIDTYLDYLLKRLYLSIYRYLGTLNKAMPNT